MALQIHNIGVVGYGRYVCEDLHIPFITITPQFNLHSIVQRHPSDGNSAPVDHLKAKHYTDVQDMLADSEVDVIVITTPANNHFQLAKAALESGKHVLVEKPFVPTSAEADKLVHIAKQNNRLICVYQNRRWDSDFLTVKQLISQDTLGRVLEFNTHFDHYTAAAPAGWKGELGISQGGGAIFELGAHLIDQAYVLFGMPQAVFGHLLSHRVGKPDLVSPDAVSAELAYTDGKLVNIRISPLSIETTQSRFWVRGSKGSLHKIGLDPQEDQLKVGLQPTATGFGKDSASSMRLVVIGSNGCVTEETIPDSEPETYRAFYIAFARAIESCEEEDIPVKAGEASNVLRIIEAIRESAETGERVYVFSHDHFASILS